MKRTAKIMPLSVRMSIYAHHVPLPATKLDYQTFFFCETEQSTVPKVSS